MARAQTPMLGVKIVGTGMYVPGEAISNEELIARFGIDSTPGDIVRLSGIENRYISGPSDTVVTLGTLASLQALEDAGVSPDEAIDYLTLGSSTASTYRPLPGAHPGIQRGLHEAGFRVAGSEQVNTACTSFVTALISGYRRFTTDGDDLSLVVGSDTISRITDYSDRGTGILFGDGAGAVVLRHDEESGSGMLGWHQATDGRLEGDLFSDPASYLQMSRRVFPNASRLLVESARISMARARLKEEEIDLVVPHQANTRILEAAAKQLGIPIERFAKSIVKYGNTSAGSVPMALYDALRDEKRHIERGQRILFVGFGAGMTVASAIIEY